VLLDAGLAHVVQVAVVQVIDVAVVPDGFVAAIGAVLVLVVFVMDAHSSISFVRGHGHCLQLGGVCQGVLKQIGNVPIR
jgi:hypothetical protein